MRKTTIGELKEAVEKAFRDVHSTVPWRLGRVTRRFKVEAPYLIWDGYDAAYSHDGDYIIVGDAVAEAQRANFPKPLFEIDRNYVKRWELGDPIFKGVTALDYDAVNDRVIACVGYISDDVCKIIEVKDGGIVNGPLTGTTLGEFGLIQPGGLRYSGAFGAQDVGKFWVADPNHHVVVQTNWDGAVLKQFGVYGEPGNDDAHLNTPNTVCMDGWVADTLNHRVLNINYENGKIVSRLPHPVPGVFSLLPRGLAIGQGTRVSPDNPGQLHTYFYYHDEGYGIPTTSIQVCSNTVQSHPKIQDRILMAAGEIYEFNISNRSARWFSPWVQGLWNSKPAAKDVPEYSAPVVDWFASNQVIRVLVTQSGKITIEAARWAENIDWVDFKWTGDWDEAYSGDLIANKLFLYDKQKELGPFGVYRIKVTLDADGILDGWVITTP